VLFAAAKPWLVPDSLTRKTSAIKDSRGLATAPLLRLYTTETLTTPSEEEEYEEV
jgi:hypothetical protein